MSKVVYRYLINSRVPIEEVEGTLLLSVMAAQALHGEASTRLDGAYFFDSTKRACVIDAGTPVGRDFNRFFVSFMMREFGSDAVSVHRVLKKEQPQEAA